MKTQPDKNAIQSLAEVKGIGLEQAASMASQTTLMAKQAGDASCTEMNTL